MVNLLDRHAGVSMAEALRRWVLCLACAATLASCGGGQGDAPAPPAAPSDATGTDVAIGGSNVCDPITLAAPRAVSDTDRIALNWRGPAFKTVTVWVQPAAGKPFEPVDALVIGRTAEFSRGPAYRLDFPTARVRVRGCTDGSCIDSNHQPMLDALLGTIAEMPSPNPDVRHDFGNSVAVSADGTTLAVGSSDHLHLFQRDRQGRWQKTQVLDPPACSNFVAGFVALDGAGATLAASREPLPGCPADAGTIEVFARSGARWEHAARIADEPTRVGHRFGLLSLASDGRTLAASTYEVVYQDSVPSPSTVPWSGRARVYVRDDAGQWVLASTLIADASGALRAAFGTPALSGNGMVLALQGGREVTDPRDPQTRQPDDFVALFTRDGASTWTARTMVRSTKPEDCCFLRESNDWFGNSLALDHEGNTLAVGAPGDNSDRSDMVGDPNNAGAPNSGAVWIYARTAEAVWSWQAFIKTPAAIGPFGDDYFGFRVALDRSGRTLASTALGQSQPAGVYRNQEADRFPQILPSELGTGPSNGGAAYVFARDDAGRWTQRATVVPPVEPRTYTTSFDGLSMAFSADASTLVLGVGAFDDEDFLATLTRSVFVY